MTGAFKFVGALLGGVPQWIYIAAAVGAAAMWIDHRGYERAEEHNKTERLERIVQNGAFIFDLERQLDAGLAELGRATATTHAQIQKEDQTVVQPIIRSELARDPELASRVCLTPELVRAVNVARGYPGAAGETEDLEPGAGRVPEATRAR